MDPADKCKLIDLLAKFLANEYPRPAREWAMEWARMRSASQIELGTSEGAMRDTLRKAFGLPVEGGRWRLAPQQMVVDAAFFQSKGREIGKGYYELLLACGHSAQSPQRKPWHRCLECLNEIEREQQKQELGVLRPKATVWDQIRKLREQEKGQTDDENTTNTNPGAHQGPGSAGESPQGSNPGQPA